MCIFRCKWVCKSQDRFDRTMKSMKKQNKHHLKYHWLLDCQLKTVFAFIICTLPVNRQTSENCGWTAIILIKKKLPSSTNKNGPISFYGQIIDFIICELLESYVRIYHEFIWFVNRTWRELASLLNVLWFHVHFNLFHWSFHLSIWNDIITFVVQIKFFEKPMMMNIIYNY